MTLTPRVKESIKTALAMTIAYGIALSMDWDRPYWAGFAVALISLSSIGQSLNKGAMRMLGTLVALTMSLFIISLFVQDRWLFMLALSGWVGFCTYKMVGSRHSYFWFLAGFACVVIAFDGGIEPVNAFDTAIIRAQETALGILVYTLITTLLWPTTSRAGFESATRVLVAAQHQLYGCYQTNIADRVPDQDESEQNIRSVSEHQLQALTQFGAMLEAVLSDSYEFWELRQQWHRFQNQSMELHETLERWHANKKELGVLDLNALLPNLESAITEIDQRFAEIERLFAGEALQYQPQIIDLSIDQTRLHELSPFHKTVFVLFRTGLQHLDKLTGEQFNTVLEIKGFGASVTQLSVLPKSSDTQASTGLFLDTDSLIAAFRAMLTIWVAYLLWIYFRIPDGNGLMAASGSLGIMLAANPRISIIGVAPPVLSTIVLAGAVYVFVMPHLSSFIGLGAMLFIGAFTIAYLFSKPQQGVIRSIGMIFSLIMIGVSNSAQEYDIVRVINTFLMFMILIGVLITASHFPFSARPDKVFMRLLGRFFHSSEYLFTTIRRNTSITPTPLDSWRQAYHSHELASLPQKLSAWGKVVNTRALSNTTPVQLQTLSSNLQMLAYRMQELMTARCYPQSEFLLRELLTDVRAWHLKMQNILQDFSRDPAIYSINDLREQLTRSTEHLELRIEKTLNKAEESEISVEEGENFYRLLGACRGLSDAVIEYAGTAEKVDWEQWRESRF